MLLIVVAVVALAEGGTAFASAGFSWSAPELVDHQPPYGNYPIASSGILSVSCPSVALCVAGDNAGKVLTSTDPTGGLGAWTGSDVDPNPDPPISEPYLYGVSCPAVSLCVAVDYAGNVVVSKAPTAGARARWAVAHLAGAGSFNGVSCPSVALCVAVDTSGDVATTSDPVGRASAWKVQQVDSATFDCDEKVPCAASFDGVSCASASLCVAVDDAGDVVTSTDPTGGPSAWRVTNVAPGTANPFPGGIYAAVSCPSRSLCAAVENMADEVITSTNPTGGPSAWTATVCPPPPAWT